jgi:hypothetical protein
VNFATNLSNALQERVPDLVAAGDTGAVETIVKEAEKEAKHLTAMQEVPNTFVYQATVIVLGVSVITVLVAQLWLALMNVTIPDGLIAIGSAAIGALAGLLAPTPAK